MHVFNDPAAPTTIRILYDRPRSGLAPLGIREGTLLFEGVRDGDTVTGRAVTFSRQCGPQDFAVSGQIVNGTRVLLRGQKPIRGSACAVTGASDETLEFNLERR